MSFITGIFVVLHGLVHIWYLTLSRGWVDYQPDMGWTGRSWLLSGALGDNVTQSLASALYVIATLALVVSGIGLMARAEWVRPLLVASAGFSTAVIVIFWDGGTDMIVQKGLVGVLINLGIEGAALVGTAS